MASSNIRRVNELALCTHRCLSNAAVCSSSINVSQPLLRRDFSEENHPISCKVAIVTGGARGIGYHISEHLLQCGAKAVILGDVLTEELEDAACKLNSKYGDDKALFQPCDVTKKAEMEKLFQCTKDKFGKFDIVVNNAGIAQTDWDKMIHINVNGLVHGTLLGMQFMGTHKGGCGGCIINVASILGLQPLYSMPVYSGTKWFVIGFTRSMGDPYFCKLTKVKVMALCPGVTDTVIIKDAGRAKLATFDKLDKEAAKCLGSLPSQGPEESSRSVTAMLKDGENGSVWVSETYGTNMSDISTYKLHALGAKGLNEIEESSKRKELPPPDHAVIPMRATSPTDEECKEENSCKDPKWTRCIPKKKSTCKKAKKKEESSKKENK